MQMDEYIKRCLHSPVVRRTLRLRAYMKLGEALQQPVGEGEACALIDAVERSEVEQEMLIQFLESYFDQKVWNQWKEFDKWTQFNNWIDE